MSEEIPLSKVEPTYTCKKCGYADFLGTAEACPVCDPELNEETTLCFFLNRIDGICNQDMNECPYASSRDFESCEKLERFIPVRET